MKMKCEIYKCNLQARSEEEGLRRVRSSVTIFINGKKIKAHEHFYIQHPNPNWASHMACSICGFATSKSALLSGGILPRQLSAELAMEKERRLIVINGRNKEER